MKKIIGKLLMFLCMAVSFIACSEETAQTKIHSSNGVVTETVEYENQAFNYTRAQFKIHKFEYEGHTYLYFIEGNGDRGWGGMCHDENCRCRKQQKQ